MNINKNERCEKNLDKEEIENYCILNAKMCLSKGDSYLAKSWFLTASNLYPSSFNVQFERYLMAKDEGNLAEACKYFTDMFINHQNESVEIKLEIYKIVSSVKSNSNSTGSLFHRNLFQCFTSEVQHKLLLFIANRSSDPVELCQLMLLMLKRFPSRINEHGINLVDIIVRAEKNSVGKTGNYFSKLLVYEVLPVILAPEANLTISQAETLVLLNRVLKFYIDQTIIGRLKNEEATKSTDLYSDDELEIKFEEAFNLISKRLNWTILVFETSRQDGNSFLSGLIMSNFQRIHRFFQTISPINMSTESDGPIDLSSSNTKVHKYADETAIMQVFYSTFVLFLKCLNKYLKETAGKLILVERNVSSFNKDQPVKKRKVNSQISLSTLQAENLELQENFLGAVQCFEFLSNDYQLHRDLSSKLESFGILKSRPYAMFLEDYYTLKANYDDLVKFLSNSGEKRIKCCLQLISSSLMIYDFNLALKFCLNAVSMLGKIESENENTMVKTDLSMANGRALYFVGYTANEVLSYCIDVIITCLKDQVLLSLRPSDAGLGHLIVLTQYNWPEEVDLFIKCILAIKKPNIPSTPGGVKFTYPYFCDFIFNPDILEEFMALVNTDGLTLELKELNNVPSVPIKFSKSTSKSMTTRGVNKSAKEEIKSALINQMKRSKYILESSIFINFILTHIKDFLLEKSLPLGK